MCSFDINFAQNLYDCAMAKTPSFNKMLEDTIRDNWDKNALTDYKGITLQYHDVARKIEKLHIMLESCGLQWHCVAATVPHGHVPSLQFSHMVPLQSLFNMSLLQSRSITS